MAEELLGVGFDIHGGGSDLVFPHHENEAAQTRAARGAELARLWMHNGMIQFTGEKMAKSVGNIALLHEVLERVRRARPSSCTCVSGHYRQPLAFSPRPRSSDAARRVQRDPRGRAAPRRRARRSPPEHGPPQGGASSTALADDFNTADGAGRAVRVGARGQPARAPAVGDADLREMLGVLGPRGADCAASAAGRRRRRRAGAWRC